MSNNRIASSALLLAALAATACGSNSDEGTPEGAEAVAQVQKTLLTTLAIDGGEVKFYEHAAGGVSLTALIPEGSTKLTARDFEFETLESVYKHLGGVDAVVPRSLLEADARVLELAKTRVDAPALVERPGDAPTQKEAPALYSNADHESFRGQLCWQPTTRDCRTGFNAVQTNLFFARSVTAVAFPHDQPAIMMLIANGRTLMDADAVPARTLGFESFIGVSPTNWWHTRIEDASGFGGQMSIALHAAESKAVVQMQQPSGGLIRPGNVVGTNWQGDAWVMAFVCNLDAAPNQCFELFVGRRAAVDGSGNASYPFEIDCWQGRAAGRSNTNAYVNMRGEKGNVVRATNATLGNPFHCQ